MEQFYFISINVGNALSNKIYVMICNNILNRLDTIINVLKPINSYTHLTFKSKSTN
jgi:hypothetical protein